MIMAVFWLFLYMFVNLTSILFLGALAISNLVGAETTFHADHARAWPCSPRSSRSAA